MGRTLEKNQRQMVKQIHKVTTPHKKAIKHVLMSGGTFCNLIKHTTLLKVYAGKPALRGNIKILIDPREKGIIYCHNDGTITCFDEKLRRR